MKSLLSKVLYFCQLKVTHHEISDSIADLICIQNWQIFSFVIPEKNQFTFKYIRKCINIHFFILELANHLFNHFIIHSLYSVRGVLFMEQEAHGSWCFDPSLYLNWLLKYAHLSIPLVIHVHVLEKFNFDPQNPEIRTQWPYSRSAL